MTDGDTDRRTAEQAWADLLDEAKPPHPARNWFAPYFWPLAQAAYAEPVLRGLYPGQSVNNLGFFENELWWTPTATEARTRPVITTTSFGTYRVVVDAWTQPTELILTADPAEAARFVAHLLAEQA